MFVEGAQEAEGRGLVDTEPVGDLSQVGGPLGEQRQDAQRSVDGLAHARTSLCPAPPSAGACRSVFRSHCSLMLVPRFAGP
ncbi:hypothetical protein Scani_11850 [Streptomyces caniferus]|uniref:Uncharacterized protein n=1 Tax=Streptomyces caniferus TaxID=285557 RepID=A0A640S1S0_9ACTN|nr:hypothetical protein Scani_11850 [Streptomyces caniferus]